MRLPNHRGWTTILKWYLSALILVFLFACNKGGRYDDDGDDNGQNPPPGFSLSGTIGVADNTFVDLDTNDEGATTVDNDNFGQAQELTVPAVLGGYVNRRGQGATGNSFDSGDPSDFYRVTCTRGQTIFLSFSEDAASQIHLFLYDDARRLVDTARGAGNSQSLTIDAAGTYFLEVFAETGAANYSLSINLAEIPPTAASEALRLSDDFIPGEAIVTVSADRYATAARQASAGVSADLTALGITADGEHGPQLIRFSVGDDASSPVRAFTSGLDTHHRRHIDPGDGDRLAKWDTLEMVRYLRTQAGIETVDLNYRRYALAVTPNDTYFENQWHYPLINLPNAWEQTQGTPAVLVAVIDSGVLLEHPDLQGQLVAGYDFIADANIANDGDGRDDNPDDPGDSLLRNSSFHGTHVAGTVAARSNNAGGVTGVGWQTRIMPLRVLGVGGGTSLDLIQAIRYAAGLSNQTRLLPSQRADVINMSLGGEQFSTSEQSAITAARNAGLIIVAAAGNSGDQTPQYPASYDGVVSVSAVDNLAAKAPYSSFGAMVDVAAPGGDMGVDSDGDGYPDGVLSTCGEESDDAAAPVNMVYCYQQGTSMAAPHVAAVAALMKAVDPDMTPDDFDARLISGELTRDLGAMGRDDEFGHGLIDAYQSVLSAQENAPTVVLVAPSALTFGRTDADLSLAVSRLGSDALTILSLDSDTDWVQAEANAVDANGFGTYRVMVDRTGLADGIYTADLALVSSADTQSITVRMQVLAETTPGDLANHYILLVDSVTGLVTAQAQASETNGNFTVADVRSGNYYLVAGTDMDNDNFIGDAGEAFGAYLSLDNPVELTIDGDRGGLDLITTFRLSLPGTLPEALAPNGLPGYPLSPGAGAP